MDVMMWLQTWLKRHPLKEPADLDDARYTAEVMDRINTSPHLSPAAFRLDGIWWWLSWPRLALSVASAAVAVALAVGLRHGASGRLAERLEHEAAVVASLEGESPEPFGADGAERLADEVDTMDALILLAESVPSDSEWIERTAQLLHQLDEDVPGESLESSPDDLPWLELVS